MRLRLGWPLGVVAALAGAVVLCAQTVQPPQTVGQPLPPSQTQPGQAPAAPGATDLLRPSYVLGANDQVLIRAAEVEEINEKPFRVDGEGFLNLPLLGRVRAGGLTVQELEVELATRLKMFVREPQVIVTVVQFRSEPVFFVGAFHRPGIYALQGRRTLVEMLSSIGGLLPTASRRIRLARRKESGPIPLPNAVEDAERKASTVEISMGSLRENVNPAEDVVLQPFDVITVERAEMVYINGDVGRVGGFELGERESISVIQLLTMAGGLGREAKPEKARILRPVLNTPRRAEIPINIKRILAGQDSDYPLLPNDLLYVPRSGRRQLLERTALVTVPLIPTLVYLGVR